MVRGWRSPHPLPTCKPAGGRRGGEQPGRRSLEGVGGVLGFGVNFWKVRVFIWKDQISNTCVLWIGRLAEKPVFSRVEWEERYSNERESFIVLVVLFVLFSGFYRQCLTRSRRRKYSPINV